MNAEKRPAAACGRQMTRHPWQRFCAHTKMTFGPREFSAHVTADQGRKGFYKRAFSCYNILYAIRGSMPLPVPEMQPNKHKRLLRSKGHTRRKRISTGRWYCPVHSKNKIINKAPHRRGFLTNSEEVGRAWHVQVPRKTEKTTEPQHTTHPAAKAQSAALEQSAAVHRRPAAKSG